MRAFLIFALLWASPALAFEPDPNGQLKTRAVAFDKSIKAPKGRLTDENGKTHRLSQIKGEVSVVTMWTTLCHVCRTEMPMLAKLAKMRKGTPIKIRPVNVEAKNIRTPYILRHMEVTEIDNLPLLRDLDRAVWNRVGARGTPTTIVIDRYGQVVSAVAGAFNWLDPEVIAYLDALAVAPNAEASRALLSGK